MTTKSTRTRQGVQLTFSCLLAALCLVAAPAAGGARAAGSLDAFGDDVELRLVDARTGAVPAALDRVDLATLLPSLGAPDRGPASLAAPTLDSTAWRASLSAAAAGPSLGPNVSGLPWRSGASCGTGAFETWRGRKLDVAAVSVGRRDWATINDRLRGAEFRAAAASTPQLVVTLPLLPVNAAKQFAACARGDFDYRYRDFGMLLSQAGAGGAVLRLGWEANIGSRSHPWGYDTAADARGYVQCFRRAVAQLRSTAPKVKIEWSNAKAGKPPFSVLNANPGDDVVDLWGLHYYDADAQFRTQASWDQYYNSTHLGGPQGFGRWLAAARARGKKLAIPEWGVWSRSITPAKADNPLYIQNMYKTLKANAATIAYESYFNCPIVHRLHPDTPFPKASVAYRQLWSAGK